MKTWNFRPSPPSLPDNSLAEKLQVSQTLLSILWGRGFTEYHDLENFLTASLRHLTPPQQWPGFPEAAQILAQALCAGKKLAVWGDYDVDGITATTLVLDVLEAHHIEALWHLPDRHSEGYGLNIPAIEMLAAQGAEILLTVDCGISDVAAIARARELGMTVVLSDHHLPPSELPPAHAICNPRLDPEQSPCVHLAGVGVAFFLMAALNPLLTEHTGVRYKMDAVLDLVALGTLADIVRLSGENRLLVKGGLRAIANAARPGMAALKKVSGIEENAPLSSGQVSFRLAPRINAAGRMGHASLALHLLRSPTIAKALPLAEQLDTLNTERRQEEERIFEEAKEQAQNHITQGRMGLVLHSPQWHSGIIGIVASRIAEEFSRPTFIVCDDNNTLKGSGRSFGEFHLHATLTEIQAHMLSFGGHRMAAGLRLAPEKLLSFTDAFDACVQSFFGNTPPQEQLLLEGELDFSHAGSMAFVKELEMLQPFGPGNAEPVFASPILTIQERRPLGRNSDHILLHLRDESTQRTLQAKAWRQATTFPPEMCGQKIRVAYSPRLDMYNGIPSIDLHIRDWQPATPDQKSTRTL